MNNETKMCARCRKCKPLSAFSNYMKNGKNIRQGYCKICKSEVNRMHYMAKTDPSKSVSNL